MPYRVEALWNKRAMMALDRSPESFFPQINSTSLFLWFQVVTLRVGPVLTPKGIIWIRLIKVHKEMLNIKYQSSNPFSFRKEEFWSWFSLFLCSNLWPQGQFWPHYHHINKLGRGPQGLNTKYQSSMPSSSEKKNFEDEILCSYVPTCDPPGWGQSWPQEHHLNKLGRGPLENATYQIWKL